MVPFYAGKGGHLSKTADISVLPANPLHVTLYLTFLIQKSSTSAPVEEAMNALSWAHQGKVPHVEDWQVALKCQQFYSMPTFSSVKRHHCTS